MLHEGAFFAFKDDTVWGEGFDGMPHAFGNVYPILTLFGAKHDIINNRSIIIMGGDTNLAP